MQATVKGLVANGQLTFLNGGWCVVDYVYSMSRRQLCFVMFRDQALSVTCAIDAI